MATTMPLDCSHCVHCEIIVSIIVRRRALVPIGKQLVDAFL